MLRNPEQSDQPTLEELHTFVSVASQGSISGAAKELGLPKSTVSRRLSRLEERLGIRLVQRTTRKLSLTYEGQIYRDRVALALGALEEAHEAAREKQEVPRGHLRVTAPVDLGLSRLVPVVSQYIRSYPQTSVELLLTERIVDLVGEGVDLALRGVDRLEDSSLIARPLGKVEMVLAAAPDYLEEKGRPASPDELADHPFLLRSSSQGRATLTLQREDDEAREEVDVEVVVTAGDFTFLHQAVLQGLGIGVLPLATAEEDFASGRLERVLPAYLTGQGRIFLVHPGGRLLSAKVRAFRELILEQEASVDDTKTPKFPSGD